MAKKSKPSYYAVKIGRTPGIYKTWPECKNEVLYFSGARYKGFNDLEEAHNYLVVPFPAPANTNAQIHDGNDAESAEVDEHDGYTLKRKVESLQSDPEFPKKHKAEASPSQSAGVEAPKELLSAGIFGSKAVVYTDGACTDNGRGNAQAGCGVYWGAGSPLNLAEKVPGPNQTNNRGEMMAFIRALERCPADIKLLNIYSDSEYTINCLTKYRAGYEKRNFESSTSKEELIKNVDMIKYLYALFDNHSAAIKVSWVKGHNNHPDNEFADALAVAGAKMPPVPNEVDWESLAILHKTNADDLSF